MKLFLIEYLLTICYLYKTFFNAHLRKLSLYTEVFKPVFYGRLNWSNQISIFKYATKKSAEEILGINKPKRPLTPFFKFTTQIRPALLAKNPGITSKEVTLWCSTHWKQLDAETKTQMSKEYQKDLEDYKKIKGLYESSLTDEQKEEIKKKKEELAVAKEKRKLKAEFKEMGRPKRPMSSYVLFGQTKKELMKGDRIKEHQEKIKAEWLSLPESERLKFKKQAQQLMEKYKKDLEAWELKMISLGRLDLVKSKSFREKKHIAVNKNP